MWDIFKKLEQLHGSDLKQKPEFLIVGLGNYGSKYVNTRHNAGFIAIDALAKKLNVSIDRLKFKSLIATAAIGGKSCLLMKPQTYMNNSGEAVVEAMRFYKIPSENIIVLVDDIMLDIPKIRIRAKGSFGGQNGLKSIIEHIGTENFPRVRIGVGKKPHQNMDTVDWVLSKFSENDLKNLEVSIDKAVNCLDLLVNHNFADAMNKFNS